MKTTRYSSPFFALKARHVLKRTCTEFNQKSVAPYELPNEKPKKKPVVKPVCNDGPVYIGHPVYYGYWTTLRKYCHMCSVKLICIKRSSLYNGCGHPLDSQNAQFHYILPVYNAQQIGKLQYVWSTVDGKMNVSEIVKSVNLFMAIERGNYKRWMNSTSSWI